MEKQRNRKGRAYSSTRSREGKLYKTTGSKHESCNAQSWEGSREYSRCGEVIFGSTIVRGGPRGSEKKKKGGGKRLQAGGRISDRCLIAPYDLKELIYCGNGTVIRGGVGPGEESALIGMEYDVGTYDRLISIPLK